MTTESWDTECRRERERDQCKSHVQSAYLVIEYLEEVDVVTDGNAIKRRANVLVQPVQ